MHTPQPVSAFILLILLGVMTLAGCAEEKKEKKQPEVNAGDSTQSITDSLLAIIAKDSTPEPIVWSTKVVPNLRTGIPPHTNVIYSVGFQLAWDDLRKLNGEKIEIENGPNSLVDMNHAPGSSKDISQEWAIALSGVAPGAVQSRFAGEFSRKFNLHDTLVPDLMPNEGISMVGYVWKPLALGFRLPYYKQSLSVQGTTVDAFGIGSAADAAAYGNRVTVHYYNGPDDFIVSVTSDTLSDRLVIAQLRKPGNNLLRNFYDIRDSLGNKASPGLNPGDRLLIPAFHFEIQKEYPQFKTGRIKNPTFRQMQIANAKHIVRVGLGNDAMSKGLPDFTPKGKRVLCDKPFMLMVIEKDAPYPWLMMWVDNPELMWTGM